MDVLSDLLHRARAGDTRVRRLVQRPPWSLSFVDTPSLTVVAALGGTAVVRPHGGEPVPLAAGDVALLAGPNGHTIADSTDTPPMYIVHKGRKYGPGGEPAELGPRTYGDGLPGATELLRVAGPPHPPHVPPPPTPLPCHPDVMPVREAVPADRAAIAALWSACHPYLLTSEASVALRQESPIRRMLHLVCEDDAGRVIACGATGFHIDSTVDREFAMSIMVDPHHRRHGAGSLLYERLRAYQDDNRAAQVVARAAEPEAVAFAERRGFAPSRTERISRLELSALPEPPAIPGGYRLVALSEVDDLPSVYAWEAAIAGDIPADHPYAPPPYDAWLEEIIGHPHLDHDASVLLLHGETVAAMTQIERVGDRLWSGLTGTRPEHRGRGLGKVVKAYGLARAREAGARTAYTNNDEANAPMLAVNTWLGYRPHVTQRLLVSRRSPAGRGA